MKHTTDMTKVQDRLRRARKERKQKQEERERNRLLIYAKKDATTRARLIARKDSEVPWVEAGKHFQLGPRQQDQEWCPRLTFGDPCPVCDEATELFRSGNRDDVAYAKKIAVSKVYLYPAIRRGEEQYGTKILVANQSTQVELEKYFLGDEEEGIEAVDLTDPTPKGYDILISRESKEKGWGSTYSVRLHVPNTALGPKSKALAWIKEQPDIEAFLKDETKSYEQLAAVLAGESVEEESGEVEEEESGWEEDDWEEESNEAEADDESEEEEESDESEAGDEWEEEEEEEEAEADWPEDADEEDFDVDEETGEIIEKGRKSKASRKKRPKAPAKKAKKKKAAGKSPEQLAQELKDKMKRGGKKK